MPSGRHVASACPCRRPPPCALPRRHDHPQAQRRYPSWPHVPPGARRPPAVSLDHHGRRDACEGLPAGLVRDHGLEAGAGDVLLAGPQPRPRSEEHTSELQSRGHLVCRLLPEKKKNSTTPSSAIIVHPSLLILL